MVTKTTRITIETESLLMVHKGKTFVTWCAFCCAQIDAMVLEAGHGICCEMPPSLFHDWLAGGKLHLWTTEGGQSLICLASLFRCFDPGSTPALKPLIQ